MNKIKANTVSVMKEFRMKELRFKICCACVSNEYFINNLRDYYGFISCDYSESKKHGFYSKTLFMLRNFSEICDLGIDSNKYSELPLYVCVSKIY